MSYDWFRFYKEWATDPVVQVLAFEDQRHFVMSMCMQCDGLLDREFPTPATRNRVICATLGLDPVSAGEANRRLREVGLVDEAWHPLNWDKRQFVSDHDAAERKRRQRAKEKDVTAVSRDSHVLDTDTEQKQKRTPLPPKGAEHVFGLDIPSWMRWEKYRREKRKPIKPGEEMQAAQEKLAGFGEHQAAVVKQSIQQGWTGLFAIRKDAQPTQNAAKDPYANAK